MTPDPAHLDPATIGLEAYVYLYPLVTMELTRRQLTNAEAGTHPGRGPANTFVHIRQFPEVDFRDVVRPNFDTLYSSAWLDLSGGPLVLSTPDFAGRYHLLPLLDMWTDVFAVPGWRTTGTAAHHWLIAPPGWTGDVPDGLEKITAPTDTVWIIGRIQTNGPGDYPAVNALQDGLALTPLANWLDGSPTPAAIVTIDPDVDMETEPLHQVNGLTAVDFFTLGAELMTRYPPHPTDWSQLARMARIGVVPGRPFEAGALDADVLAALEGIPAAAHDLLEHTVRTSARQVNGWVMNTDSIGVYGNFYSKRAAVTMVGLGANPPEDAIYPIGIAPADGSHRYVLHLAADALPPVDGFWSLTMYDQEGFQIANPIDRFAIGDRDALRYNADGSLDIIVQAAEPDADHRANWLPAPDGPFSLLLRLYAPRPPALDGRWNPPALEIAD
jgi:hypothetical protein